MSCCVCFEGQDTLLRITCGHVCCDSCFQNIARMRLGHRCPQCRAEFDPDDALITYIPSQQPSQDIVTELDQTRETNGELQALIESLFQEIQQKDAYAAELQRQLVQEQEATEHLRETVIALYNQVNDVSTTLAESQDQLRCLRRENGQTSSVLGLARWVLSVASPRQSAGPERGGRSVVTDELGASSTDEDEKSDEDIPSPPQTENSWSSLAGLFTLGRPAAAASPLSSSTSSTIMQRMRQAIPPVSWAGQSAEARERQPGQMFNMCRTRVFLACLCVSAYQTPSYGSAGRQILQSSIQVQHNRTPRSPVATITDHGCLSNGAHGTWRLKSGNGSSRKYVCNACLLVVEERKEEIEGEQVWYPFSQSRE
ncbi:unnamed protein product [Somion occarium]|uniref:RING-type domain-containing protein n=1 Tax=Somion occarium TaxID=3059160 RepID=A0ABP1DG11_9APHY